MADSLNGALEEIAATNEEVIDTLVIDPVNRTIQIPKNFVFGVYNDKDVLKVPFSIPRYYGDCDFSDFRITINYLNAAGDPNLFDVSDLNVGEDTITFTWTLGRGVFVAAGQVKFVVCVREIGENGRIAREFNTGIYTADVLGGLEVDDGSDPEAISILTQMEGLRDEVSEIADSANSTLSDAISLLSEATSLDEATGSLLTQYSRTLAEATAEMERVRQTYGSPLVASTASAMTDTDKVYVYTGSESGYTSGNWYYYDGSAWVSGGVYNSAAINTDTSLSVSGMAADAAAVGVLKNALNESEEDITFVEGGEPTTYTAAPVFTFTVRDTGIRSNTIAIKTGDTITYNRTTAATGNLYGTASLHKIINGSDTYISIITPATFTADQDMEVYIVASKVSTSIISLEDLCDLATPCFSGSVTFTKTCPLFEKIADLQTGLDGVGDQIAEAVAPLYGGKVSITPEWTPKYYYNSTLTATAYSNNNMVIAKVDISEYVGLNMQLSCYASSSAYCGFTDPNDIIISVWHQSDLETHEIPFNAKYLYISHSAGRVTFVFDILIPATLTETATLKNINNVKEYDSTVSYTIGDICVYNNTLYSCIVATTGAFDTSCWEESGIVDELLKRDYFHPITKLNGLTWDARGDSITAGSNGPSYVPYMTNLLGIAQGDYTNSGIGGVKISGAYNGAATDKDFVTLFAGTNDFGLTSGASTLETFETNLRTLIFNFRSNNQTARLYLITPIPRFDKTTNEYNLTLLDYVNKMNEVCGELNVPCLNLYERCGINANNYAKYLRAANGDLIHPNLYGAVRVAVEIARFVSEMEAIHRVVTFR